MKKSLHRVLPLFIAAMCLLGASAARGAVTTAFTDVAPGNSNILFINYLSSRGIIGGFPDGTYRPGEGLTRAEAAAVLAKAAGLAQSSGASSFSDVSSHWAAGVINAAAAAGMITGYPDGTFRPDAMVTRAEGITMFLGLSKQPDPGVALPLLEDVSGGHWAARTVAIGLASGMVGLGGKNFFPDSSLSRGDMARILGVLLTKDPDLSRTDLKITFKTTGTAGVTRKSSGETEEIMPGVSVQVDAGDIIKTGGSTAQLILPDGSGMLLEEESELTVKEARGRSYITAAGRPGVAVDWLSLDMEKGSMFGTLAKNHHNSAAAGETGGDEVAALDIRDLPSVAGLNVWNMKDLLLAVGEAGTGGEVPWWESSSQQAVRVQVDMPWGVAGVRGTTWRIALEDDGDASFSILEGEGQLTAGGATRSVGQLQVVSVPYGAAPGQASAMTPEEIKSFVQEAVRQWLQERAEDMQANSELYVQVDEAAPPSIVEIINQAIEEAVRESEPTSNNNNTSGTSSPVVSSRELVDGLANPMDKTIKIYFDGVVKQGSNYDDITLTDWSGEAGTVPTELTGNCLTVDPVGYLHYGTTYTLKIPAGAVGKLSGNGVNAAYEYSFTTSPWLMSDAPWTMYGHDPQRSGQSQYSGPDCPGLKWEKSIVDSYVCGTPLVGPGGLIYMVDSSGGLSVSEEVYVDGNYDLNVEQIFSGEVDSDSTPAIGNDGTVYYCAGNNLYAVNIGYEEMWSLDAGGDVSESSPTIGPDGTIYIVAQVCDENEVEYGYLLAVNPGEPEDPEKWRIKLGQGDILSPAVGPDGTVYVVMAGWYGLGESIPGQLFAVNPDGTPRWEDSDENPVSVVLGEGETFNAPVVGPDGTIYVVCEGILKEVSPQGELEWSWDSEEYGDITGSPAVGGDGTVYLSTVKYDGMEWGYIYKIIPGAQPPEIIAAKEYKVFTTPAIGSDGTVYAVSPGYLWAFDSQGEDQEKWVIETNNHLVFQPVIGANGTIYLCSAEEGGSLITAIREDSSPLNFVVYPDPEDSGYIYGDGSEPANMTLTFNKNIKKNIDINDEISFTYKVYDEVEDEYVDIAASVNCEIYGAVLNINAYPSDGHYIDGGILSIPYGFVTDLGGSEVFEGFTIIYLPAA